MTATVEKQDFAPVSIGDIIDVIGGGVRDFAAAPVYAALFGGLFAVAGWLFIALLRIFDLPFLAYPLAMGFALVSPFAAIGFYAISELNGAGEKVTLKALRARLGRALQGDLRWMALVTGFALVIWLDIAALLFFGFVGPQGFNAALIDRLLTTPSGLLFLALGNLSGAVIAMFVFSISAISFPMLFDRDVDFVTAMTSSVRFVMENPGPLIFWCALIGVLMGLSVLSGFLGFFVILPVIGCATWRLYKKAVS